MLNRLFVSHFQYANINIKKKIDKNGFYQKLLLSLQTN